MFLKCLLYLGIVPIATGETKCHKNFPQGACCLIEDY